MPIHRPRSLSGVLWAPSLVLVLTGCPAISGTDLAARIDRDEDGGISAQFGGDDCDDADPTVFLGADDAPYDGIDANCDGLSDDDADGDGFDDLAHGGDDCDDGNVAVHPGAIEACDGLDSNCDGSTDADEADGDGDGFRLCDDDCDDTNAAINPGADEICDDANTDEDCDGSIDDGDAGVTGQSTWYQDLDDDGYGDDGITSLACDVPDGFVTNNLDCDDGDDAINPDTTWYLDGDSDGFGDDDAALQACEQPGGYVLDGGDCDDADTAVNPGATEVCNDIDDDCDDLIDSEDPDDVEAVWYRDRDDDGYGDDDVSISTCSHPSGYVQDGGDCDDSTNTINAGATEVCDLEDNDCDGDIDDADPSVEGQTVWYADTDYDGWGNAAATRISCFEPAGYVGPDGDCDDTEGEVNPDAVEVCNSIDDDCDADVDDADDSVADQSTWYSDSDGDGYGLSDTSVVSCDPGTGWALLDGECNDASRTIHPDAAETWYDGVDADCDGHSDYDADLDGYDIDSHGGDDCDDGDAAISPEATETWYDGVDADCDGLSDFDQDLDGHATLTSGGDDCDDLAATIHPGIAETWYDGVDEDCDGASDYDQDADGYLSDAYSGDDCDDADPVTNPGTPEIYYDGADNDCDGLVDGLDLANSDAIRYGEDLNDNLGSSAAGIGDVNGDGYDDVAIGAGGEGTAGTAGGAVYIQHGPFTGTANISTADAKITALAAYDYLGSGSVDGGFDEDGDGQLDLLVGAFGDDTGGSQSGAAYVLLGPITGTISLSTAVSKYYGTTENGSAARVVAFAGDPNSDGFADYLVSGSSGSYLLNGPTSGTHQLGTASARFTGTSTEGAPTRVDGPGDVDGDGVDDLILGAADSSISGNQSGAAYLELGPVSGSVTMTGADGKFAGERLYDYAGQWVAGAGDVNGDGRNDFLIGASGEDTGGSSAGAVYLILGGRTGSIGLSLADAKLTGEHESDYVGQDMSTAGDIDGDGFDDLLIPASSYDGAGSGSGVVYLVHGPVTGIQGLGTVGGRLGGTAANDYAGTSCAAAGDVDGDGLPDVIIGAYGEDTMGSMAGAAYLLLNPTLF